MERRQCQRRGRRAPSRTRLVAVLCLAMLTALVAAGPAEALSGYATPQPAVNAQYPDQGTTTGSQAAGGADSTLQSLMATTKATVRSHASSPRAVARRRQIQQRIVRQERGALSSAAGLTPTESGSLVLLLGAAGVMSVAAILRWRRGPG